LFENKKLSELTDQDKAMLEVLKKQSMKNAKLPKKELVPIKEKILSATGKVLKGAGKVIKPLGYVIGANAVLQAQSMADEMGIELSLADKAMALDSGDANVAIDNYKRRNIPGYSEKQAGITLGKFQDDFSEVGKQPMNIDLTMPRGFNSLSSGGVASGPPPESGPNPQGLLSLMKRVKKV